MTLLDVITDSLLDLGVIAQGDTPNADEQAQGLRKTNQLLDEWNTERLNLYTVQPETHALTMAKGAYTIGPAAADFPGARPLLIQTANLVTSDGLKSPMDLLTSVEWAAIRDPSLTGKLPDKLYCDYNWPISKLNVSPIPIAAGSSIELYVWQPLASFASVNDTFSLPPAYTTALEWNLALRLAPSYGEDATQLLVANAAAGKQAMAKYNSEFLVGVVGAATTGQIPAVGNPRPSSTSAAQATPPAQAA